MSAWFDGRQFARETVRDFHVLFERTGLSRQTLFTILYALHIMLPLITIYIYITVPAVRPVAVVGLILVMLVQFYTRTCPIAKLEWALDPLMEQVTWKGAEILNCITTVNKSLKFYFMVVSTAFGLIILWVVARLFPNGIHFT